MLSDARFLQSIFAFSQNEKDFMNDETVELMAPYLELEGFNPAVARNASKAAEGLCTWCRAMTYYHEASKVRCTQRKWALGRSSLDAFLPAARKKNLADFLDENENGFERPALKYDSLANFLGTL